MNWPASGLEVAATWVFVGLVVASALAVGTASAQSAEVPENISIATVDGEDAAGVTDLELRPGSEFEVTVDGVDTFEDGMHYVIYLDGERVREARATSPTVAVHLGPEELERMEVGGEHELTVGLRQRDAEVRATTTIRVSNLEGVESGRGLAIDSEFVSVGSEPSGIEASASPSQAIRMEANFRDAGPSDVRLTIDMFGPEKLPPEMSVTGVSAESDAWPVEATPTDDGVALDIQGEGGPESGTVTLTVDYDASDVYEAGVEPRRGLTLPVEDQAGDVAGEVHVDLWAVRFFAVVETPDGERLTPDTDRENWKQYYSKRSPPFDPTVDLFVGDGRRVSTSRSRPTADGVWPVSHTPGDYLRVDVDGYADPVIPTDDIDPSKHDTPEDPYVVELSEGGQVAVALTDQDGEPLPNGRLELEDADGIRHVLDADDDGVVRGHLEPGTYTGVAGAYTTLPEDGVELSVSEGGVTEAEYSLTAPEVVDATVEHVGGTRPDVDALAVDSIYYQGAMIVSLKPESASPISRQQVDEFGVDKDPHDVSALGVDETTELRITVELEHFEPDSLFWAARDARWEVLERDGDRTVVEIETKATEIQKLDARRTGFGDASSADWPSGDADVADEAYDAVVEVWLFDLGELGEGADALSGVSVMTNAQQFSVPQMAGGELSLYMAAPHETVDGEVHTGYYQAFLSDDLLQEWDVENPEEDLEVRWAGTRESFSVEEVEDGVFLEVEPVHYSDGRMRVRSLAYEPDDGLLGGLPVPVSLPVLAAGAGALLVVLGGLYALARR